MWLTIEISALALVPGTILGAVICLLRTQKNAIVRGLASVYIALLRGTPVLMLLLLLYSIVIPKRLLGNDDTADRIDETAFLVLCHLSACARSPLTIAAWKVIWVVF